MKTTKTTHEKLRVTERLGDVRDVVPLGFVGDERGVSLDELLEVLSNGVAGLANAAHLLSRGGEGKQPRLVHGERRGKTAAFEEDEDEEEHEGEKSQLNGNRG